MQRGEQEIEAKERAAKRDVEERSPGFLRHEGQECVAGAQRHLPDRSVHERRLDLQHIRLVSAPEARDIGEWILFKKDQPSFDGGLLEEPPPEPPPLSVSP